MLLTSQFGIASGDDAKWGRVTGRVVWQGDIPDRTAVRLASFDVSLKDESLLINPANRGVSNVLVAIQGDVQVHPKYAARADAEVQLDIRGHRFEPRMLIVRAGQSVVVKNLDKVGHNLHFPLTLNPSVNVLLKPGGRTLFRLSRAERGPIRMTGSIHSWLSGYLVVCNHPYAAVTDENGEFELRDVPVGEWTLQSWHERRGYLRRVAVNGEQRQSSKGRLTIQVDAGETDLGTIRIAGEYPGRERPGAASFNGKP